jgi:branched-subunit amino acid ABC-type transport system permease component
VLTHRYYRIFSIVTLVLYIALLCVKNSVGEVAIPLFLAFDAIFLLDMLLKVIIYRFVGRYSYTDRNINVIDMVINLFVIVSLFMY